MKYRIRHKNRYQYGTAVSLCHSQACLLPRDTLNQHVLKARLTILPVVEEIRERTDLFGNRITRFSVETLHAELTVLAESEVEVRPVKQEVGVTHAWDATGTVPPKTRLFLRPSVYVPPVTPDIEAFSAAFFTPGRNLLDAVGDLNRSIFEHFVYDPEFSDVETPAHLMLAALRGRGLAARYVSGYLETDPPPGQPKLLGSDASHAWVSVFVPGAGWVDFDPTNGLRPSERHMTLAWGRDYADVVPLKGLMTGGNQHGLEVSVDVIPVE
jgi:transglutaminase-like putative cysteine protease